MPIRNRAPQDPVKLLDFLTAHFSLKNDAALVRLLGMTAPQISKIRSGTNLVSGDTLLRIHDATGLSIALLREQLAAPAEEAVEQTEEPAVA